MGTWLDTNSCEMCKGAGFLHPIRDGVVIYSEVVPCACSKERIEKEHRQILIKSCALPPFAGTMTMDNFKRYAQVEEAYQSAKSMAENPGGLCWLALIGGNGNGKTHLAVSVCKAWVNAGIPARYALVSLLLDELRLGFQHEDDENSYERRFRYYCNIPLLLLDDYGMESKTAWVQEKLDTIVDYRLMNNLSLIVTSNLALDEMPDRIRSRLLRHPNGKVVAVMAGEYSMRGDGK